MSKFNCNLTAERVREVLHYDSDAGVFTWKVQINSRVKIGEATGHLHSSGYLKISVDGTIYRASRLAWLYSYGAWPDAIIDHKDRCPANNRIGNLQDVSYAFNNQNRSAKLGCLSSFKGVSWHTVTSKWRARIWIAGKERSLGYYTEEKEAAEAYLQAAKIHHPNSNPVNI